MKSICRICGKIFEPSSFDNVAIGFETPCPECIRKQSPYPSSKEEPTKEESEIGETEKLNEEDSKEVEDKEREELTYIRSLLDSWISNPNIIKEILERFEQEISKARWEGAEQQAEEISGYFSNDIGEQKLISGEEYVILKRKDYEDLSLSPKEK